MSALREYNESARDLRCKDYRIGNPYLFLSSLTLNADSQHFVNMVVFFLKVPLHRLTSLR